MDQKQNKKSWGRGVEGRKQLEPRAKENGVSLRAQKKEPNHAHVNSQHDSELCVRRGSKSLALVIPAALWKFSQVGNSGIERLSVHLRAIRGNL